MVSYRVKGNGEGDEKMAAAQNQEALCQAMDQLGDRLLRTALLLLRDRRDAEEAVADTFLRYYQTMDQFRGESSLSTYLTAILLNCCRRRARSAWLRRVIPFHQPPEEPDRGEIDQTIDRVDLTQALWTLPRKDREVLLLYYYQDLTTAEIARLLGQREGTVRSRLSRARDKLKELLKEGDDHEIL